MGSPSQLLVHSFWHKYEAVILKGVSTNHKNFLIPSGYSGHYYRGHRWLEITGCKWGAPKPGLYILKATHLTTQINLHLRFSRVTLNLTLVTPWSRLPLRIWFWIVTPGSSMLRASNVLHSWMQIPEIWDTELHSQTWSMAFPDQRQPP